MQKHKNGIQDNMQNLADDTRALLAATADVAGEKVAAARERVTQALETAQDAYHDAQKTARAGAKAADKAIRDYPYHAMGVAFVIGAAFGALYLKRK